MEPEVDAARVSYRKALVAEFERLIRTALDGKHLPDQDAALAAPALVGALIEGLIGPLAPDPGDDPAKGRGRVQALTLSRCAGSAWSMRAPAAWWWTAMPTADAAG